MDFQRKHSIVLGLSIGYFTIIVLYSICVYFEYQPLKFGLGFLRIPVLMLLYFFSSRERNFVYFSALFFYQIASVLFNINTDMALLWAVLFSDVFRLLLLVLVYKIIEEKRWCITIMTSIPLLIIYLYLIDLIKESLGNAYIPWIINGFLTAYLGGLAVTNYVYKDDRKSFWLVISALLFVIQIGLFFMNKFYLKQQVFLQLIILLYGISHYTFYKFMIVKEDEGIE